MELLVAPIIVYLGVIVWNNRLEKVVQQFLRRRMEKSSGTRAAAFIDPTT